MSLDAAEIATQLTVAWINHSTMATASTENPLGQNIAKAYDTILTGVYKAMDNVNQLKKTK